MITYLKKMFAKKTEKQYFESLRDKIDNYIEAPQGEMLENKDNYIDKLFHVLNELAAHKGIESEKNYQSLLAFVMQKTVPLYFKDYSGTSYEVQGYKEINKLINEKFEKMIIEGDDQSFEVWKKLKNEEPWEDYPTALVPLLNIFHDAEIKREKRILKEKSEENVQVQQVKHKPRI